MEFHSGFLSSSHYNGYVSITGVHISTYIKSVLSSAQVRTSLLLMRRDVGKGEKILNLPGGYSYWLILLLLDLVEGGLRVVKEEIRISWVGTTNGLTMFRLMRVMTKRAKVTTTTKQILLPSSVKVQA